MSRAAADDRSRGKSYSNANAATPRYGQCNRQALQLFKLPACNGNFLWEGEREGYLFSKKRYPSLVRAAPSALLSPPPLQGRIKKEPSLAREKVLFDSLSKPYRYFCIPSVARAGSPETEIVNFTPVALLKRSSSLRKSSAAWLHSPPVILKRLSMKMWEIS